MIHLSPAAISEILRLKARRKNPQLFLRLGVQPSNCLSLSYTMEFDEQVKADDRSYDCGELTVVIEQANLGYLTGLVLDYSEDLMGGGFRFHNPNITQSCGCGNSFSVAHSD